MKWWLASVRRAWSVCPECAYRFCAVYAALGTKAAGPTIYMRHRGWWK